MRVADARSRFEQGFGRVYQLKNIVGILHWDMNTMMPPGGTAQRGEQMAFLEGQIHAAQSDPAFLEALETLAQAKGELSETELAAVRWQLERARRKARIPARLVEEVASQNVLAQPVWVKARAEKNFAAFLPMLTKSMELAREVANAVKSPGETAYEGLMAEFEPGAPLKEVERLFAGLRRDLVPLLKRILDKKPARPRAIALPIEKQVVLNRKLVELCGFDFERGRLDVSVHPFCGGSGSDIRLTSRYFADDFTKSLFAALHEGGHGMYELGMDRLTKHRALREAPGLGFHESQSRFWENHVGRSRPMLEVIREELASLLGASAPSTDELYAYVNHVEPSYIRVEADEATYNLHILLRFEIESALIEGKLAPKDVPDAWWAKAKEYVGIERKDDSQGCLQDVHWSIGLVGYFPTYTLGNLIAAQLYERARRELDFPGLARGRRLSELRDWLGREVHAHGCALPTLELAKKATGRALGHEAFVKYLEEKHLGGH
jgi:carboxypeptidase Taq